jgi:hypothetical protein
MDVPALDVEDIVVESFGGRSASGMSLGVTRYLAVGTRIIVAACLVTAALLEKFYFTPERLGLAEEYL